MPDLFKDWIPSINQKTENLFHAQGVDDEFLSEDYNSFLMNKAFSQNEDTLQQANIVNVRAEFLTPKMQYDFLYHTISKKKRFSPWAKAEKNSDIDLIRKAFSYNRKQAEVAIKLLSEDDLKEIEEFFKEGGKGGK